MKKRVFYSFYFDQDCTRVQQIRNIGLLEGNSPVTMQRWENVKRGGDAAIKRWIADNMYGKGSVVVLVGAQTASRPWVQYEIEYAIRNKKKLLGVRIHGLKDINGNTSYAGPNPFEQFTFKGANLARLVPLFEPEGWTSKDKYASIRESIEGWIDDGFDGRVTETVFGTVRARRNTLFG